MKQIYLKFSMLLLCLVVGLSSWAEDVTGTITFGSNDVKINAASVTGDDDLGNTWTITTDGTTSFTSNAAYYQVGSSKSPAKSLTFTTTLLKAVTITSMSAKFGGFSDTAGTVTLKVGETTIGTGSLNATNDVTVNSTSSATGTVLTVTVTGIAKGVKCYNISYTYVDDSDGTPSTPTVTAPTFDVAAGTYTEDQLVLIDNYNSDYIYAYTTDGTDPTFDEELNVTNGTTYDNDEGIEITSSCTLKVIAVDEDGNTSNITSTAYVINKLQVFASLEELVAADLAENTLVKVTFTEIPIKSIYVTKSGYKNGIYFDIQKDDNDIEIYYNDVPNSWVVNGTVSGTIIGTWKKYNNIWELVPTSPWDWNSLTYNAPAKKTITALEVSGTPTKTEYYVGDAFEPAGLTVTATYSDKTKATITKGFEWEIDYGTGNDAFVAGATSVDVMAYIDDMISEVYTVNGIAVNVPITLTSIAVSGTPTKASYYAGDKFETAGLVVTATYSDNSTAPITEGIEWTVDPETLTEGTTSVDVMASIGNVVSEVYTVEGLTVTENPYKTATISTFSATSGGINTDISYEAFKGNASTAPAVNSNNLRLYQNGGYITITATTGLKIASVKITTSDTYASTTVGYCVDDEDAPTTGETVAKSSDYTISNLNNSSVSIYCLGTDKNTRLEIAAIEVKYSGTAVTELKSIALSGTYPTEFTKGDEFSHEGMTVTATYTDGTTKDVTSEATFTGYNMSKVGEQTVTVSYSEEEITKTATYTLTVNKAPFVPTPVAEGYEIVDFSAIYSSVTTNATVEDYEGTSFAMAFAKPQSSTTPTKYYESGRSVRAYEGNTITITAAEPIKNVNISWTDVKGEDTGVKITGIRTTNVVVTFSSTCSFDKITVCYKTVGTISVGEKEWATYYTDKAYIMPRGVRGVTVTACSKDNDSYALTLKDAYESGSVVPAETPLLINAAQGSYDLYPTSETGTPAEGNLLLGQLEAGQIKAEVGDYYYYKLTTGSDAPNVGKLGFYWGAANGGVFNLTGSNRAYLVLPQSMNIKAFAFDGMETAISTILSAESNDVPKYNVAGQRIKAPVRGQIYIQNGKKYIVK